MDVTPYAWRALEAAAANPVLVQTDAELAEYARHWNTLPCVALDTEFQRIDTFYPIPGLIQLADDHACYLIDPLTITDFTPFTALLTNTAVVKVLHASSEDLELFLHSYGAVPAPLFDTQLAAAFVGWGFSMGLARMLEHALGVQLEKQETTSDWLQRPLTQAQEQYAALDVAYLPAIYHQQRAILEKAERLNWVEEENQLLAASVKETDPQGLEYYKRFTQMWRLPEHKRAALRDLSAWRERESRRRNVPRNRLIRNHGVMELMERWPRNMRELGQLSEMKRKVIREDGQTILDIIHTSSKAWKENPAEPIPKPLHIEWNQRIKALKKLARERAAQLNIAPEVLLKKKDLEALVRSGEQDGNFELPAGLMGWRKPVVGELLLARVKQMKQENA